MYLSFLADRGLSASSIGQRDRHRKAGHEAPTANPVVQDALRGIRRTVGTAPKRKSAATADRIRLMLKRAFRCALLGSGRSSGPIASDRKGSHHGFRVSLPRHTQLGLFRAEHTNHWLIGHYLPRLRRAADPPAKPDRLARHLAPPTAREIAGRTKP
jgi:hypothetical protein